MITLVLGGFAFLIASAISVVPENGSIALFGVGLLLLGHSLRRVLVGLNTAAAGGQSSYFPLLRHRYSGLTMKFRSAAIHFDQGAFYMPRRLLLLAAVLVILPLGLMADNVTLTLTSPGNNISGNYYASPYQATVQGTGQVLTIYCIDFNHDVSVGQTWNAVLQSLTQSNVATTSQEGAPDPVNPLDPNAWQDYSAAAYLIDQQIASAASAYWAAVYQYAAWKVFLPYGNTPSMISTDITNYNNSVAVAESQYGNGTQFATDIAAAFAAAGKAVSGGYTPMNFELVTPNPQGQIGSVQEFLVKVPPVPEPSSIILLLTSAFAGVIVVRRKRRQV